MDRDCIGQECQVGCYKRCMNVQECRGSEGYLVVCSVVPHVTCRLIVAIATISACTAHAHGRSKRETRQSANSQCSQHIRHSECSQIVVSDFLQPPLLS